MPRIPTEQIEAIKRDVSCRAVLEAAAEDFRNVDVVTPGRR